MSALPFTESQHFFATHRPTYKPTYSSSSSSSSSTTNAPIFLQGEEKNFPGQADYEELLDEAKRCLGEQAITGYVRGALKHWMEYCDYMEIMYALSEAASAPRPSWRYTEAILRRLAKEREANK